MTGSLSASTSLTFLRTASVSLRAMPSAYSSLRSITRATTGATCSGASPRRSSASSTQEAWTPRRRVRARGFPQDLAVHPVEHEAVHLAGTARENPTVQVAVAEVEEGVGQDLGGALIDVVGLLRGVGPAPCTGRAPR